MLIHSCEKFQHLQNLYDCLFGVDRQPWKVWKISKRFSTRKAYNLSYQHTHWFQKNWHHV